MTNIAVLMTCHNRKEKTLRSLRSLAEAFETCNLSPLTPHPSPLSAEVFLTDDGCTDGTAEAVLSSNLGPLSARIHIIRGDGDLYWAGGMRVAWREALRQSPSTTPEAAATADTATCKANVTNSARAVTANAWDYYLLLNDDTVLFRDVFAQLFAAEQYCREHFGQEGIVSGMTCDPSAPQTITYGGEVFISRLTCRRRMLEPTGAPQLCDWTHANILLVARSVVERQGILYDGYRHGQADLDYGYRARLAGIPVVVTAAACGFCAFDHPDIDGIGERLCAMTLSERRAYLNHPLHSDADYLTMIRRCMPAKYPMTWIFRKLNLYAPRLYFWLNSRRGVFS